MGRTVLSAGARKDLILDAAQHLFVSKGFQATTVEDILTATGIAKGTLYYHFAGKDQVLAALIERTVARVAQHAQAIAASDLAPVQKFLSIVSGAQMTGGDADLTEQLHAPGNAEFHLQSNVAMVRALAPALTEVVEQGIEAGVFTTPQPREDVEIILVAGGMLTDEGIFVGDSDERPRRMMGVIGAAERLLGCQPGTFMTAMAGN